MEHTEKDMGKLKGAGVFLMLCGFLMRCSPDMGVSDIAAILGKVTICLFVLAAGWDFYGRYSRGTDLTALINENILGIYIRYWPVLFAAVIVSLAVKAPREEHYISGLIYSFIGLRFPYCAEWSYIPAFVLVLASAPVLLKIIDRKNAALSADALFIGLFTVFTYFVLPKIMNAELLLPLNISVLWKSIYTALEMIPAFAIGCLMAKYDVLPEQKGQIKAFAWLEKSLKHMGEAWLSVWLISSLLCTLLGKYIFSLPCSALFFALLLIMSILCAVFLETMERKVLDLL